MNLVASETKWRINFDALYQAALDLSAAGEPTKKSALLDKIGLDDNEYAWAMRGARLNAPGELKALKELMGSVERKPRGTNGKAEIEDDMPEEPVEEILAFTVTDGIKAIAEALDGFERHAQVRILKVALVMFDIEASDLELGGNTIAAATADLYPRRKPGPKPKRRQGARA